MPQCGLAIKTLQRGLLLHLGYVRKDRVSEILKLITSACVALRERSELLQIYQVLAAQYSSSVQGEVSLTCEKHRHHFTERILTVTESIELVLAGRWAEYQRLRAASASYSALVRLAEMDNVLEYQDDHDPVFQKWKLTVGEAQIPDAMRGAAIAEAVKNVSRLQRMLSIGTTFTYEELMLAITIRVELELFARFLAQRGDALDFHLSAIDDELRRVSGHHENASAFRSAQMAARRNWGAPIRASWIVSAE
jgi:hypothetical protein